jgi:UDP-N-acetylglucosamine--N-acetylmuramyl-(pentapeptide) pyrophosphoryl-undecaprenol N-acetylglucosamine transferase
MFRRRRRPLRRLALAASPGGHVDLLVALAPAFEGFERTWLLPRGSRMVALRGQGERTAPLRLFENSRLNYVANLLEALVALGRCRPQIVVTSGAGIVVPFCLLARLIGARLVFVETMARVTTGSATGRFLTRLADVTLVQWPENLAVYPGARVCSPVLLESEGVPAAPRAGTFVALGTHWQPFNRLMEIVERAAAAGILPTPVLAQVGEFTFSSTLIDTVSSVEPERLSELMRNSEVIVCHGGAGIIATAIRAGRRPLALARRHSRGEHIDDHQHEIVDKLADLGLLVRIGDEITVADLQAARRNDGNQPALAGEPMVSALGETVRGL